MAEKIEIVSREIVKPSSSNHNYPKIYTFSFFDQLNPCVYMPLLFFYTSTKNGETDDDNRSNVLKLSLSAALSRYYPLAGRVKDGATVDCNDKGAVFLEARIECSLSQVLENSQDDQLVKLLFPYGVSPRDSFRTGPLAVQVTYFRCGGMSLGIYLCHKMMDIASTTSFIKDWASLARNSEEKISPEFDIESLYPPLDLPFLKQNVESAAPETKDCVSRRVVFDGSKIAKLKEMMEDQVPNPTRVEVVSSLLFKSAISANAKAISPGHIMSGFVNYAINLRPRVSPLVSERKKGNMSVVFQVSAREDKEVELGFLVKEFRKEKTRFSNSCADITNREDLYGLIMLNMKALLDLNMNAKHEMYTCTSWCRYPFYESDFGWGKPLWVATDFSRPNTVVLIDTREGDGIEAFIRMEEKAMAVFEKDQELLSFSCVNPSVLG